MAARDAADQYAAQERKQTGWRESRKMKSIHNSGKSRLAVLLMGLGLLAGCAKEAPKQQGRPAVPVSVATVETRTMPVEVTAIGAVEAFSSVQVKTQVTGQLVGVYFKEGDDVKKGQLLFALDPRQM